MPSNHDEYDDFFGDDDDAPVVDTRADGRLLRVPLARLSPNLVNPRKDFGTKDELVDFGKSLRRRQLQACPVVGLSAYLKLWPDHAEAIGNVDYVIVSGERRFRGATEVALSALTCVVDDDVARDRKTFMEAVVSENVDRQNFDAVEEAYAVQALVEEFGSNRAVAQHFERADGWVTQRILLTHLAPPVQDLVRQKKLPLEPARSLGKLARDGGWDSDEQLEWWRLEQQARKAASDAKKQEKREGTRARSFTAVKQTAPPGPAATIENGSTGLVSSELRTEAAAEPPQRPGEGTPPVVVAEIPSALPEPRDAAASSTPPGQPSDEERPDADVPPGSADPQPVGGDPWESVPVLLQHIVERLPADDVVELTMLLQQHNRTVLVAGKS
jgi:ParB family chromosome partitioning protein